MSRPESHDDLTTDERRERLAEFDLDQLLDRPKLLRLYASFVEETQRLGGTVESAYRRVTMYRPRTEAELDDQLKSRQNTWDQLTRHRQLSRRGR